MTESRTFPCIEACTGLHVEYPIMSDAVSSRLRISIALILVSVVLVPERWVEVSSGSVQDGTLEADTVVRNEVGVEQTVIVGEQTVRVGEQTVRVGEKIGSGGSITIRAQIVNSELVQLRLTNAGWLLVIVFVERVDCLTAWCTWVDAEFICECACTCCCIVPKVVRCCI